MQPKNKASNEFLLPSLDVIFRPRTPKRFWLEWFRWRLDDKTNRFDIPLAGSNLLAPTWSSLRTPNWRQKMPTSLIDMQAEICANQTPVRTWKPAADSRRTLTRRLLRWQVALTVHTWPWSSGPLVLSHRLGCLKGQNKVELFGKLVGLCNSR